MVDADQASSHPWVWTKIWPWYIVFHLCRILSGWLQGTGVPLPPSSSPDWRTASRPSCTCRPLGKERWRANVGISLKKDCRVSWFESTELLPKRWPKLDPWCGSGKKCQKHHRHWSQKTVTRSWWVILSQFAYDQRTTRVSMATWGEISKATTATLSLWTEQNSFSGLGFSLRLETSQEFATFPFGIMSAFSRLRWENLAVC